MTVSTPTVAIVGIGGIFPDAPDLDSFWANIRNGRSAPRDVSAGRWQMSADVAFDPSIGAPDRVYSRRGCFIDQIPDASTLDGLVIDPARLEGLDPLFHLLIHAGKRALDDGVTTTLDRSRVGVIIGNLALPSETSTLLARPAAAPNSNSFAGSYTLSLQGCEEGGGCFLDAIVPYGDSPATVRVSASGNIQMIGTLADGEPISQYTAVSTDGSWPLYAAPYRGQGI